MDPNLKRYLDLKKRVEEAQQRADRAEGALQQVMKQLQEDFGCSTLGEAKKKLKILERQKQEARSDFENNMRKFEEKWKDNI